MSGSDDATPHGGGPAGARPEGDEARRRRVRQAVFGDVLPDTTSDERDDSRETDGSGNDAWLRSNVPPHHG